MRYAANLETLWQDQPLLDRFEAAHEADFTGVELPNPYEGDVQALRSQLLRFDLKMVMIACPPPNYTGGIRGFAADPGAKDRFQRDFKRVLRYASILKPEFILLLAGPDVGEGSEPCLIDNLSQASKMAPKQKLLFQLDDASCIKNTDKARAILEAVSAPNLGLMLSDVTGVDTPPAHIQITSRNAARDTVCKQLGAMDYTGWVSAAYRDDAPTEKSLAWRE